MPPDAPGFDAVALRLAAPDLPVQEPQHRQSAKEDRRNAENHCPLAHSEQLLATYNTPLFYKFWLIQYLLTREKLLQVKNSQPQHSTFI